MAYRTTVHSVTRHSPFKMIYGRKIIGLVDLQMPNKLGDPEEYMKNLTRHLINIHKEAYLSSATSKINHHSSYEKNPHPLLEVGDKVWMIRSRTFEASHKFNSNFVGPYTKIQKYGHSVFSLKREDGSIISRVHRRFIRKCVEERKLH